MKKTLTYGLRALSLAWKANGFSAVLAIVSALYDSTLYPFIQVFLLAQLLDLFQKLGSVNFSNIAWIIAVYLLASIFKLALKGKRPLLHCVYLED